jgi:hypothetical protein
MSFDEQKNVCTIDVQFFACVSLMQVVLKVTYSGINRFARSVSHDRK